MTLFLTILFLVNIQMAFADTPITSFQTDGDMEISALGRYGIRLCRNLDKNVGEKEGEEPPCSFFHKEGPSANHYSDGLFERMDDNSLPSLL
ncbi:MAG: hypothetical protein AAB309_01080, partial [Deltaproteobacteria bacterium]